ncbi:MAG: ATP-binding protein [Nitriliruptoraceae bacterium]
MENHTHIERDVEDARTRRAVEFLLHTALHRLRMDGAFFVDVAQPERTWTVTTDPDEDPFTIGSRDQLARLDRYVHQVLDQDGPWVVRDTANEPSLHEHAVTIEGGLAAYLGVPVRSPAGKVLGVLGCMHHVPRPDLDGEDVAIARSLAQILGLHLTQLAEGHATLGRLAARVTQLGSVVDAQEVQLEIYRRMVDASLNATLLLDLETLRIEYANLTACELVGRPRAQLLGRHPWELHACWEPDRLDRELAPLQHADAWPVTYELAPLEGAPAMDVQAQRFTNDDGRAFVMWEGRDIDTYHASVERLTATLAAERQATEKLQQVDQLKTAFLTAVSHEVRTPLTIVKGMAELLEGGNHGPDTTAELLRRLCHNAGRLERLLTDLLDLNQFTHGELRLAREAVDLATVVRRAVDELDVTDHPITFDLTPIDIEVAPIKVERIVANLVLNATIHTKPGTPIDIALIPHHRGALLIVTDHGPGIPPEQRERVFETFRQGERVPAHNPGTGIGLSLVAAFAELHGGTAWVQDAQGGGSAFHVLLPDAAHAREANPAADPGETPVGGLDAGIDRAQQDPATTDTRDAATSP